MTQNYIHRNDHARAIEGLKKEHDEILAHHLNRVDSYALVAKSARERAALAEQKLSKLRRTVWLDRSRFFSIGVGVATLLAWVLR